MRRTGRTPIDVNASSRKKTALGACIPLFTEDTGFYERYGWEFLCMVQGDEKSGMTRMYIHR